MSDVEGELLREALVGSDRRRLLELGTGFGPLLGGPLDIGGEVVASDLGAESLTRIRLLAGSREPALRVAANLHHLPFVDGAFMGATMIRVHHHLGDPIAGLTGIARVLCHGGRLVVSDNARPSLGALVNDIQRAIHRPPTGPFRSLTSSREARVTLPPDPFPIFAGRRVQFGKEAERAGSERIGERVSGLEEYYLRRFLPTRFVARLGEVFGNAAAFPMRFAILPVREGEAAEVPALDDILACPRCRHRLRAGEEGQIPCPACSFWGSRRSGALDPRYVPPGVPRIGRLSVAA
ncbi:MAG TPA: methyltransferase domain-containing protein [Thermoplasmata archaeon]|nr:methyltransferase domain-containing protein [Thermoplasmata archaeon]